MLSHNFVDEEKKFTPTELASDDGQSGAQRGDFRQFCQTKLQKWHVCIGQSSKTKKIILGKQAGATLANPGRANPPHPILPPFLLCRVSPNMQESGQRRRRRRRREKWGEWYAEEEEEEEEEERGEALNIGLGMIDRGGVLEPLPPLPFLPWWLCLPGWVNIILNGRNYSRPWSIDHPTPSSPPTPTLPPQERERLAPGACYCPLWWEERRNPFLRISEEFEKGSGGGGRKSTFFVCERERGCLVGQK